MHIHDLICCIAFRSGKDNMERPEDPVISGSLLSVAFGGHMGPKEEEESITPCKDFPPFFCLRCIPLEQKASLLNYQD
ncbi:hypothetical protein Y1Q_0021855 [Alligator mississippiensis]|uniref:Uncharacterized protein n=1 Tax=Alligator mississippiensis TaxID=8496 RepID=A0A151PBP2_ALLMI|nr:hypothetical protein Y1Q_0021855 [Alligator mississippiensis]